jgi:hypothetical protein
VNIEGIENDSFSVGSGGRGASVGSSENRTEPDEEDEELPSRLSLARRLKRDFVKRLTLSERSLEDEVVAAVEDMALDIVERRDECLDRVATGTGSEASRLPLCGEETADPVWLCRFMVVIVDVDVAAVVWWL